MGEILHEDNKKDNVISLIDVIRRMALLLSRRGRSHVEAAGGVVFSADGRVLMIFRRGVWDLPKGHREAGETAQECAAREVCEECGLSPERLEVGAKITTTVHRYYFEPLARHEEKHTTWFAMRYSGDPSALRPQTEEDITELRWFTPSEALAAARGSYDTIRQVIEAVISH